tara:strand:+ start:762 stop:917 length:156 start_codon:yes stop_codon:yes gene_type:complete
MKRLKFENTEVQKAYDKYFNAKKSYKDYDEYRKWFEYWLDFLIIRHKNNND